MGVTGSGKTSLAGALSARIGAPHVEMDALNWQQDWQPAERSEFRSRIDAATAITELGVGEGLVSVLDEKGAPTVVERAWIYPPQSSLPPLSPAEMKAVIRSSVIFGNYEERIDRESAYEKLRTKAEQAPATPIARKEAPDKSQAGELVGALAKSAARAIGSQIGRQIIRGVLGSIFGSGRR